MASDPRYELYNILKQNKYPVGDPNEFAKKLESPGYRALVYDIVNNPVVHGYDDLDALDLGDYEAYESKLLGLKIEKDRQEYLKSYYKDDFLSQSHKGINKIGEGAALTTSGMVWSAFANTALMKEDPILYLQSVATSLLDQGLKLHSWMTGSDPTTEALREGVVGSLKENVADKLKKREEEGGLWDYKMTLELQKNFDKIVREQLDVPWVKDTFWNSTLPAAGGSSLAFLSMSAALANNPAGASIITSVLGALAESGSLQAEAWEATGDVSKTTQTIAPGLLLGSTEAIPIGKWVEAIKFGKASLNALSRSKSKIIRTLGAQLTEGTEEALQEAFQSLGENYTAREIWDAQRELTEGMFEGGAAGFITGFLLAGMTHSLGRTQDQDKVDALLEAKRALQGLQASGEAVLQNLSKFKANATTMSLDDNLRDVFGEKAELVKETAKKSKEFTEIRQTVETDEEALSQLYDKNPKAFNEAILKNTISWEVSDETRKTDSSAKTKNKDSEKRITKETIKSAGRQVVSEGATELGYDDEIYSEKKTLISSKEEPLKREGVRQETPVAVNWKAQEVLGRKAMHYKKEKRQSFINFLKKSLPQYQVDYIMQNIDEKGLSYVSADELVELANEIFPSAFSIIESTNKEWMDYTKRMDPDDKTYHVLQFGYPNANQVIEEYLVSPADDMVPIDMNTIGEEIKKVTEGILAEFDYTDEYIEKYRKPIEFTESDQKLFQILSELGYKLYVGNKDKFYTIGGEMVVNPLLKLFDLNEFVISKAQGYTWTTGKVISSIIKQAITRPFDFSGLDSDYFKIRANDIVSGKRTKSEFSLLPVEIMNDDSSFKDDSLRLYARGKTKLMLAEKFKGDKKALQEYVDKLLPGFISDTAQHLTEFESILDEAVEFVVAKDLELYGGTSAELFFKREILDQKQKAFMVVDTFIEYMFNPQRATEPLRFETVIDFIKEANPLAYEVILNTREDFQLTGSISLAVFGTMYRSQLDPHDIDLIGSPQKFEEIFKDKFERGEAILLRKIPGNEQATLTDTYTYSLVPEGYKVGKIGGMQIILDPQGNVLENYTPVSVDIFERAVGFNKPIKKTIGGVTYNLADPRNTFQAKLSMARPKDIADLMRYMITNPEFTEYAETITKAGLRSAHYGHMPGTFGWIRGDVKTDKIGRYVRIFEIQSDYFKTGITEKNPAKEVPDKLSQIFLKGVQAFRFARTAVLSAVEHYRRFGYNRIRLPIGNTVRHIENFNVLNGMHSKVQETIVKFYDKTIRNIVQKEFGKSVKEVTDEKGDTWLEITVNESPEQINERILFEKNIPKKGNAVKLNKHKYSDVITQEQSGMAVRDVVRQLEEQGLVDERIKPLVDWMLENHGDIEVLVGDDTTVVTVDPRTKQNVTMKGSKGAFRVNKKTGKATIVINKNATGTTAHAVYNTLAHELWHKVTVGELKVNQRFRLEVEALMEELKLDMETEGLWDESFEQIFYTEEGALNPFEFLSHVLGNTQSELRDFVYTHKVAGRTKPIQRLMNIIRKLWKSLLGDTPSKYSDVLEIILKQHIGAPSSFQRIPSSEFSPEYSVSAEELQEATDKMFLLTEGAYEDPKVIKTVAKMIAEQLGIDINDPVLYMKGLKLSELKSMLDDNTEFNTKAMFHYTEHYKDTFESLLDYKDAVLRQVLNQAKNLKKMKMVRLVKTVTKSYDNLEGTSEWSVEELGMNYRDKNGHAKTAYVPNMMILDALPMLEELLGVKFDVMMGEELKNVEIFQDGGKPEPSVSWESIAEHSETTLDDNNEVIPFQNQVIASELEAAGYIYLGNWSDKKTIIILKPSVNQAERAELNDNLRKIAEMYAEKASTMVDTILRASFRAQGLNADEQMQKLEATRKSIEVEEKRQVSMGEVIATLRMPEGFPSAVDLAEYSGMPSSDAEILRAMFEDLRMGGKIVDGNLQSALFNPEEKDSYDAIKLYKRPYLISQKSYVEQDASELKAILKEFGLDKEKYGFVIKDGKLFVRAFVYDGEVAPGTKASFKGEDVDLHKMLVNSMGIARTDGRLQFVLGSFDKVWRKLHGALKTGALKFWIGNNFSGSFAPPLYVKGAGHGNSENDLTSQWMLQNNIGLLISSTAAKVSKQPKGNLFDKNPQTFLIPFENIFRDKEKGKAEKDAKGMSQSFLANWLSKINPAYPELGGEDRIGPVVNKIVDRIANRFKTDMMALDAIGIIQFFKEKALSATTNYEKSISEAILDLVLTETDQEYRRLKQIQSQKLQLGSVDSQELKELIDKYATKNLIITQETADRILNIFHEPYFAEAMKSLLKKKIQRATHFELPSVWATMDADLGNFSPERLKEVRKWAQQEYKSRHLTSFYKEKGKQWRKLNDKIKELMGEQLVLQGAIEGAKNSVEGAEMLKLLESNKAELGMVSDEFDAIAELFDDNGRYLASKDEALKQIEPTEDELREILSEAIDEGGFLRHGYVMLSEDVADYLKMNLGDTGVNGVVPSDSLMSLGGFRLVGVLPETVAEHGKVIGNSEDFQGIRGKDFDIDTMLIFSASSMLSKSEVKDFADSLEKSLENHKRLIEAEYRKVLKNHEFNINGKIVYGEKLTFNDTLNKEVRLKYVQEFNGERNGRKLYNPVKHAFPILNEYNKDIGKIVNKRKLFTLKSQIGFKSKVTIPESKEKRHRNVVITPNHKGKFSTYNIHLNQTNDMVDVPTNTNKFFYKYDAVTSFNQDNGTEFDPEDKKDKAIVRTLTMVDDFLFKYAARLTTDYNLDETDGLRELDDELKYIAVQRQIFQLMQAGNKKELYRLFAEYYDSQQYPIKIGQVENLALNLLKKMAQGTQDKQEKAKLNKWVERIKKSEDKTLAINLAKYMLKNMKKEFPGIVKGMENSQHYTRELKEAIYEYKKVHSKYVSKIASRSLAKSIAYDYINNMEVENIMGSPIARMIMQLDLSAIPSVTMSFEEYTATHSQAVLNMLNLPQWSGIKKKFNENKELFKKMFIGTDKATFRGEMNNNELALALHYLTGDNIKLHYLKAKVITLVNPVIQRTTSPQLKVPTEPSYTTSSGKVAKQYFSDIYQMANEYSYPKLFKIFMEHNKSINFESVDPVTTEAGKYGSLVLSPGLNNTLKFTLEDKNIVITSDVLMNSNSKTVKEFRDYLFGDWLKSPKNRVALSKIIHIGGEQTPAQYRIEAAAELIKSELNDFTAKEKFYFWLSLYGRPTEMPVSPNLTINKGKQFGQDRMFQLLGLVNDPQATRMFQLYAAQFNEAYVGPTFNESIDIVRLNEQPDVFNVEDSYEVYFESAMPEVEDEKDSFLDNFKTIYKLISEEELEVIDKDEIVGSVLDLVSGEARTITPVDVINAVSAYVTQHNAPINQTMIAFAKAQGFQESLNYFSGIQEIHNHRIAELATDLRKEILHRFKLSSRRERKGLMADEFKKINKMREENPYGLQVSKGIGGYIVHYQDEKFNDSDTSFEILFDRMGVTDAVEKYRIKIAVEFMKRYHVDNLETMEHMIDYIRAVIAELPEDFARNKEIFKMLEKYEDLYKRMKSFDFNYFPRIYLKEEWERIADEMHRVQVEKNVREKVAENIALKTAGKRYFVEPYASLVTEEMIQTQIQTELSQERGKIVRNSFKNYVHSWEMKRAIPPEHEGYITESLLPDKRHLRQFKDMLLADGMMIHYMQYEYAAAKKGLDKKKIRRVRRFFGAIANHKLFRGKYTSLKSLKPSDRVRFYYRTHLRSKVREDYIQGEISSIQDGVMTLKMDRDAHERHIRNEMKAVKAIHNDIMEKKLDGKPATKEQWLRINQFYEEGYLLNKPGRLTRLQANDLIYEGYQNFLNDKENWGRFKLSSIYTKEYEGADMTEQSGVMKEPPFKASDQFWQTVQAISSAAFLGHTAGASRNFIDATWALVRDLRIRRYFRHIPKAFQVKTRFRDALKTQDAREFLNKIEAYQRAGLETLSLKEQEDLVEHIVYKYALEHGLGQKDNTYGQLILNEDDIESRSKIAQAIRTGSSVMLKPFKAVESSVRLHAAYLYAYKAVIEDGITNIDTVEQAITKGIARTQSLYEAMYRRLGEDKTLGRLLFQFSQYNGFQLNMKIQEYRHAKRLGLKWRDSFSRNIEHYDENGNKTIITAGQTVDPNIMNRFLVDWWFDTIGISLGILIPGFRASNPLNRAISLPLAFLAQAIVSGDTPDDWDLRDWIYGILGFFMGVGFTIPIQVLANLSGKMGAPLPILTDKKIGEKSYLEAAVAFNPRVPAFAATLIAPMIYGEKKGNLAESSYQMQQFERLMLGLNFFTPYTRKHMSKAQKKFNVQSAPRKVLDLMWSDKTGLPNFEQMVPILNILKDM
jgi:hypothetical protein